MSARVYLHPTALSSPRVIAWIEQMTGMRAYWRDGRRAELESADEDLEFSDYTGTPDNGPEAA